MKKHMTREEILNIRCRDRADELYVMVKRFLELPNLPDELAFDASRLISRVERIPGEGNTLTLHGKK